MWPSFSLLVRTSLLSFANSNNFFFVFPLTAISFCPALTGKLRKKKILSNEDQACKENFESNFYTYFYR